MNGGGRLPTEGWIEVERVTKVRDGVELVCTRRRCRGGRSLGSWLIRCRRVREFDVSDLNGGGLQLYSSSHPAARQYVAERGRLRWSNVRVESAIGAMLVA